MLLASVSRIKKRSLVTFGSLQESRASKIPSDILIISRCLFCMMTRSATHRFVRSPFSFAIHDAV